MWIEVVILKMDYLRRQMKCGRLLDCRHRGVESRCQAVPPIRRVKLYPQIREVIVSTWILSPIYIEAL